MKKLLLICIICATASFKIFAQEPVIIDFSQPLSAGAYPWTFSYGTTSTGGSVYAVTKPTDTTLAISATEAKLYESGFGLIAPGLNATPTGTPRNVDISAQPTIKFKIKSTVNFNLHVLVTDTLDKKYNKHKENSKTIVFNNIPADNEFHEYVYTFTAQELELKTVAGDTTTGLMASAIGNMLLWFQPIAPAASVTGVVTFDRIALGEAPMVSNIRDFSEIISSSILFPNPASETTTLSLNLKNSANVKVSVADITGNELFVLAEGYTQELNKEINVSNLNKGVYMINYSVDNKLAGTKMLLVK
ncbi:MAG TPA: T9SS type A sorting domain-containing protein [Cytophagaceae bacterium]